MGYTTSPFILNVVIKHHTQKYPKDISTDVLLRYLYVDNLIITTDNEETLFALHKQCRARMLEGGFEIVGIEFVDTDDRRKVVGIEFYLRRG